jgi:serine/threonine protein phosphatase 1
MQHANRSRHDEHVEVVFSEWKSAPIVLGNETVFGVGDVHGCARELNALLGAIAGIKTDSDCGRRLVFLGDLIDRGPDTIGTLNLWAEGEAARGVDRIDRLMGNHEQLLLLAMSNSPHAPKAEAMWLSAAMGGDGFLQEMRQRSSTADASSIAALFSEILGNGVLRLFESQQSHVAVGNLIFVHAGLDPRVDSDEFLSEPWTSFTDAQWAWIHGDFLKWQGGFNGRIVIHGHTPPHMHRELTGQDDPHLLMVDRLGLDGGTTRTGIVAGAQIENGRYRILRAGGRGSGSTALGAVHPPR